MSPVVWAGLIALIVLATGCTTRESAFSSRICPGANDTEACYEASDSPTGHAPLTPEEAAKRQRASSSAKRGLR